MTRAFLSNPAEQAYFTVFGVLGANEQATSPLQAFGLAMGVETRRSKSATSARRGETPKAAFRARGAGQSTGGSQHVSVVVMSSDLAPGLLLAAPPLADPNFERSVVLLSAHGPEGAFGWVLNGQESMSLSELLVRTGLADSAPKISGITRIGGPVSQDQVWLLYPSGVLPSELEGQQEVAPGIMASASRKVLEVVAAGQVPPGLITLTGYAGWGPWQLENEIKQGTWLPTDVTADVVFDTPPAELWARAYQRVGASPMAFTTRTVGSA